MHNWLAHYIRSSTEVNTLRWLSDWTVRLGSKGGKKMVYKFISFLRTWGFELVRTPKSLYFVALTFFAYLIMEYSSSTLSSQKYNLKRVLNTDKESFEVAS